MVNQWWSVEIKHNNKWQDYISVTKNDYFDNGNIFKTHHEALAACDELCPTLAIDRDHLRVVEHD